MKYLNDEVKDCFAPSVYGVGNEDLYCANWINR